MRQVLIRSGSVTVADVPAPQVQTRHILVSVTYSCISAGTEMASVAVSGLPLYRRALQQPENVTRVLNMAREQGVRHTYDRITGNLAAGSPTGYSATGRVVAVGAEVTGFRIGERVACAGAGIANHAEVINVPVNLAVKTPEHVADEAAATVTLGAIAMQGVRRAAPTLGETIVVVGLGILGQLTVQLLRTNGCRVIGVDPDSGRIARAEANGMDVGIDLTRQEYVERVVKLTEGFGADAAIVTAAAQSDAVIRDAMRVCRRKGRVVLVGDVGLKLKRADLYPKELDFLVSTSYGPGRYDPVYEEGGQDYPLAYVRWTENRNMQSYLALLERRKLSLDNLITARYPLDRAPHAYADLEHNRAENLITLLLYPERGERFQQEVILRSPARTEGKLNIALVGGGGFAQGVHLPNITKLHNDLALRAVISRTGSNAKAVADQYKAAYAGTDLNAVLQDAGIDLILIATRHHLHARYALDALRAGKHVFVEKPLALGQPELDEIRDFYQSNPKGPVLMTGFNRRFSPALRLARELLNDRSGPMLINYVMNAGYIPPEHWVHGPEGGGRNIGEACHIYDLFNYLTASAVSSVQATPVKAASRYWTANDNFTASLSYADGSVANLIYTAMGNKAHPKERMQIFCDGKILLMDEYKSLSTAGTPTRAWASRSQNKGHLEELKALIHGLKSGEWPIPLEDQLSASRVSFEVERQIRQG